VSTSSAAPATGKPAAAVPPGTAATPVPLSVWVSLLWFGGLFVALYAPVISRLVNNWIIDEDMGHAFFVPAVAVWIAAQRRAELLATPRAPNVLGLLVIAWGVGQLFIATLGVELFLARTSMIITLAGIILTVCGMPILRKLSFPLLLLVFMIPIPAIIYTQITFPLQLFASSVAETTLNTIGIPVLREGNVLHLPTQTLSVVEACSGIRSLLSLTFLSLVYAYIFDSKKWMRAALFLATIPIAIIANAGRVTVTGILSELKPEWTEGFAHAAEGWVVFMVALAVLVLVHQMLNRLYSKFSSKAASHAAVSA
jgi:exosortase